MMEDVGDQLIAEVEKCFTVDGTGKLPDELLSALHGIFQAPLLPALDLVDKRNVTLIQSPSGRSVYEIVGSSGKPYHCLMTSNYCSCPAYKYSVLLRAEHVLCKHILAAKLASAMKVVKSLDLSDADLAAILLSID